MQRESPIGGLFLLSFLIGIVMVIFLLYQLYLVFRGMTANEVFKWEDLSDAIARGKLYVIEPEGESKEKTKKKKGAGKGEGHREIVFKDRSAKQETEEAMVGMATGRKEEKGEGEMVEKKIGSLAEVDNLYDRGFVENFKEVLFPKKLN